MKKIKKCIIVLTTLFLFSGSLLSANSISVDAASQYATLLLNDTFVPGNIAEAGTANFYSISIHSAGWLSVTFQGWNIGDAYFQLYDADQTKQYWSRNVYSSTDQNPKTVQVIDKLEAGDYIVKVYGYGSHTGDYRIKASFQSAGNNETEPNNDFSTAMRLPKGHLVTGFFSEDDVIDFYTINVPTSTTIRITTISKLSDMYISLWDSNYYQLKNVNVYYGSETNPKTNYTDVYLNPGTYYIKAIPYRANDYSSLGRYQLMWNTAPTPITAISIVGNKTINVGSTTQLTAQIMPSTATDKSVSWSSSNSSVASVDANGYVTGISKGYATITATAKDGSGCRADYSITVNASENNSESISQSSTIVSEVKSVKAHAKSGRKIKLSWKKQSNARKYEIQISNSKSFRNYATITKVIRSNKSKATIKIKTKGKMYIRIRAIDSYGKAGKWSKIKKTKVK